MTFCQRWRRTYASGGSLCNTITNVTCIVYRWDPSTCGGGQRGTRRGWWLWMQDLIVAPVVYCIFPLFVPLTPPLLCLHARLVVLVNPQLKRAVIPSGLCFGPSRGTSDCGYRFRQNHGEIWRRKKVDQQKAVLGMSQTHEPSRWRICTGLTQPIVSFRWGGDE